jgi:hypothetical protein
LIAGLVVQRGYGFASADRFARIEAGRGAEAEARSRVDPASGTNFSDA